MLIQKTLFRRATLLLISTACFALVFFIFNAGPVFAQAAEGLDQVGTASGLMQTDLPTLIGNIIKVFLSILGIIFLVLTLYAGYLWMTAGGDDEQVKKAKDVLINATIGLIITLSAYAITSFIISRLTDATSGTGGSSSSSWLSVESLSGSLGAGGIQDHYPARNAVDVARNTKIFITFKEAMDIESFISGYDTAGTPEDVTDDIAATTLNDSNILIYASSGGESTALSSIDVSVSFTDDLKTFVFDPPLLGSSTEDVSYTVFVDDAIRNANGGSVINNGGYEWSFQVGTEIDLTPPTVRSVVPTASGTYARNIMVEVTFSEAMDPTTVSGIREATSGFDNLQVAGADSVPVAGSYVISNEYKTVTFTSDDPCGTNSCGETIYCLPGAQAISALINSATLGTEPPQAVTPYDGAVDVVGNSLDGNGDGDGGDDYSWTFNTTNEVYLSAPEITIISPNILEENVALDQDVLVTFDSIMMSSSLTNSNITITPSPTHEIWYSVSVNSLDSTGGDVSTTGATAVASQAEVSHGVFLASTSGEDGITFLYATNVLSGVKNQYQNCFVPGEGPTATGSSCMTSSEYPFCCNGVPSATICSLF
ncbi:Ig-like domain-containing protein [Patescibacteria group bacterium]|nr:Ig-like domain-containing protein [Patescibacteria group bacterium]MBU4453418.1 Ig-like domain-containing protein [Patescibacteria group bacterium]